jgi:predicted ABC-type transport system involved in lysophospholipase L1 biosynthesis ATPase subunit
VNIEGSEIWSLGTDALAEFRLHKIGFVFQDFHVFSRLTTAKNVAIPLILQLSVRLLGVREALLINGTLAILAQALIGRHWRSVTVKRAP